MSLWCRCCDVAVVLLLILSLSSLCRSKSCIDCCRSRPLPCSMRPIISLTSTRSSTSSSGSASQKTNADSGEPPSSLFFFSPVSLLSFSLHSLLFLASSRFSLTRFFTLSCACSFSLRLHFLSLSLTLALSTSLIICIISLFLPPSCPQ